MERNLSLQTPERSLYSTTHIDDSNISRFLPYGNKLSEQQSCDRVTYEFDDIDDFQLLTPEKRLADIGKIDRLEQRRDKKEQKKENTRKKRNKVGRK